MVLGAEGEVLVDLGDVGRVLRDVVGRGLETLGQRHLELTGDNVTECMGGARGLKESDLARAYKSQVDPRLNYEQAMEIAMLIGGRLRTHD